MRRLMTVLAGILAVWMTACQGTILETTQLGPCTKVGQQCDLGNGVLGVCFDVSCPSGRTPPCFTCAKQH